MIDGHELLARRATSASVIAWQRAVQRADPQVPLPLAAHAEADPTGTAMTTAEYARSAFADTVAAESALRGVVPASLRPYQLRGIAWLHRVVADAGGALLADEMGLGKTVQAIGLMTLRTPQGPQLVVCPSGLISNWAREIARFAPDLTVDTDPTTSPQEPGRVCIISYAGVRLRIDALADIRWTTVVLDEAQALKNPRTQLARATRRLQADGLVALTGTPVENTLDELWAILRVVAPKLFPHQAVFRRRFTRAVEAGDRGALDRLQVAVAPVMLARKKNHVLPALPPKLFNPVLCDLTDEQASLYDRHLAQLADDGFGAGFERQGRVLAALTKLKQICNHPALVTGELAGGAEIRDIAGRSGKFDVCLDILTANVRSGSPTLVFTQYRHTGELLARHASETLGIDVPFFHGGMSAAARATLADDFQAGRTAELMVMSLKAGGVGLTLTRACDVIHFDRWWNPAVEAQASDRVHRLGQERTVTITTLTCATTLEEHIDAMHQRKAALNTHARSTSLVAELAGYDDERLFDLLRRRREGS
ncbi:MAG: DEAD/DEAH box helicase [Nakamurella sp.]